VTRCILLVAAALAWWSSSAMAQGGPCTSDIRSYCAGVQPGGGRIRACVKEHLDQLSEPCKARLSMVETFDKACADDIKQNCASVKPGRGRIIECLRAAVGKLSDACKDILPAARQ